MYVYVCIYIYTYTQADIYVYLFKFFFFKSERIHWVKSGHTFSRSVGNKMTPFLPIHIFVLLFSKDASFLLFKKTKEK